MASLTTEAEQLMVKGLNPYIYDWGKNPVYSETKKNAAKLFRLSRDPGLALHYGICCVEDWLYLTRSGQPWDSTSRPEKASHIAQMEWGFSYVVTDMERMIAADNGFRPFTDHDFLARNMNIHLEEAAKRMGLPVRDINYNTLYPEQGHTQLTQPIAEILSGQVVARVSYDSHPNIVGYEYFAGITNRQDNTRTLMNLLGEQLSIARREDELTDLGDGMEPLLKNPVLQRFVGERFAAGIDWSVRRVFNQGDAPSHYFSHHRIAPLQSALDGGGLYDLGGWRTSNISKITLREGKDADNFFNVFDPGIVLKAEH